jgi:hypothetical protein
MEVCLMAKKDKLAERMASLESMDTTCHLTREDVSRIVLNFVRDQGFPAATEASNFSNDVPVDGTTRRGWAGPLRQRIFKAGCDPKGFGPGDCENAKKVGAIVDTLFEDLS